MNILVYNIRTDANHPTQGVTTRWLNALSDHFDNIFVITIHKGKLSLKDNIKVFSIVNDENRSNVKKLFAFYKLLFTLLQNNRIDACFTHMALLLQILGSPILLLKKIPTVSWYSHSSINLKMFLSFLLSRVIITASSDSFGIQSKKVYVTGHGIDTEHYSIKSKKFNATFVIGSVGRISRIKNYETLIDAVSLLIQDGIDFFHVKLYGNIQTEDDRHYHNYLLERINKFNLEGKIEFPGHVSSDQVPDVVSTFDVFVNMLSKGGAGKAVLEAMSIEVPTLICTDVYNPFLNKTDMDTLVFKKNDPYSLKDKIVELMSMTHKDRMELGNRLRQIVIKQHSLKKLAKKISFICRFMR